MEFKEDWFIDWFNTPYYHALYDYRDEREAEYFMNNLIGFLDPPKSARLLDLPCGQGRHARFLNAMGFEVIGADISENSIRRARLFENEKLSFRRHDMREPLKGRYDLIMNLFTSFGYFEHEDVNLQVLTHFKNALRPEGRIVIDFLNLQWVRQTMVEQEQITKGSLEFNIRKSIEGGFILKKIEVVDADQRHQFIEKVQAIDHQRFLEMAEKLGLRIEHSFGDYALNPFIENESERLILILS